jgi:hypothetical protein
MTSLSSKEVAVSAVTHYNGDMTTEHRMTKHGLADKAWYECSCHFIWLGTYFLPKRGRQAEAKKEHAIHVLAQDRSAVYDALNAGDVTLDEWDSQVQELTEKMEALRKSTTR